MKQQRVLFVDDEPNVLDGLRRMVTEFCGEWETSFVRSGKEALDHLSRTGADVVVTDVRMAGMTGIDLLRNIQSKPEFKDIPVVILTGMNDRGLKREALDLGAADLLAKPIDREDLIARLRSMLHLKQYQDEIKAHNGMLQKEVEARTEALLESQAREQESKHAAELAELQNQLNHASNLESIGQQAAGIAHEINTPMQYIGDNMDYLEKAFSRFVQVLKAYHDLLAAAKQGAVTPQDVSDVEAVIQKTRLKSLFEEVPDAIQDSKEGIETAARIVRAMKEFSHPGTDEKMPIDINQAISTTITVSRNEWKYVADVETELDQDLPLVPCLPGELNQVILNLLVNAAHAVGDAVGDGAHGKGTITLSTAHKEDGIQISIKDTGQGIPVEVQDRIFEPFFTTKEVGRGTGQGLALAHSIVVNKHCGRIWFETDSGQGTTFFIWLPLTARVSDKDQVLEAVGGNCLTDVGV